MRATKCGEARKFTTFHALIMVDSPVFGLRPIRSRLARSANTPKALNLTDSPRTSAEAISSNTSSTICRACKRDNVGQLQYAASLNFAHVSARALAFFFSIRTPAIDPDLARPPTRMLMAATPLRRFYRRHTIIRSFSAAQPRENLTSTVFLAVFPSRLTTPGTIEVPLSLPGVSNSSPNFASCRVAELGCSIGDDPPPWFRHGSSSSRA
jgi:hypothetical protein